MGAAAKSYMRKGFLKYEDMHKYLVICEEAVSHIWLCNCSLLDFLIYEEILFSFFISAMYKIVRLVPFFYRAKLLWWNVRVHGLYGRLWQHSPAFLSVQCTKLYFLFLSYRPKLLWWNVPVGRLYGGLWQHCPAFLSVQCTKLKMYVLFPSSIGQNFSGGMYAWAGSLEDFDNIVRPLSSIPTDTRFFRIRQALMGTHTEQLAKT
jgi:hypothetical protein